MVPARGMSERAEAPPERLAMEFGCRRQAGWPRPGQRGWQLSGQHGQARKLMLTLNRNVIGSPLLLLAV
jgi:hypothetical protein